MTLCDACARACRYPTAWSVQCHAYRSEIRRRAECVLFADMRPHPNPAVMQAVRQQLEVARRGGHVVTAEEVRLYARKVAERAMVARGYHGASEPRLLDLYVGLVTL